MGDATNSMFYMFLIIIAVYIVGVLLYQGFLYLKKIFNKLKKHKFKGEELVWLIQLLLLL